jgi:hypothetical protein
MNGKQSKVKEELALNYFQGKNGHLTRIQGPLISILSYTQISLPGKEDPQLQCGKRASFPVATPLVGCNHKK